MENLNKENFVKFVAKQKGITQKEVESAIGIFTDGITEALAECKKVTLVGFGVFYTQYRKPRKGINPKTRKPMDIAGYNQAMVRFGSEVKKAINPVSPSPKANKKKS